ncbi:hypothetical protein KAW80_03405 [Candidatus Babeliales bacterium]|nr:hypothetical protein [Candidatus Babeliales bacterium]
MKKSLKGALLIGFLLCSFLKASTSLDIYGITNVPWSSKQQAKLNTSRQDKKELMLILISAARRSVVYFQAAPIFKNILELLNKRDRRKVDKWDVIKKFAWCRFKDGVDAEKKSRILSVEVYNILLLAGLLRDFDMWTATFQASGTDAIKPFVRWLNNE